MFRRLIALTAAGGVAAAAVVHLTANSYALKGPAQVRVTDKEIRFTRVDLGRPGLSPGDVEISRRLLYNKRITPRAIGHAELICTFTGGNSRHCMGTFTLPAGKLVVSGIVLYRQFFQLAVLGGTGLYDNARGTLTVTSLGQKPVRDLVLFRLVV